MRVFVHDFEYLRAFTCFACLCLSTSVCMLLCVLVRFLHMRCAIFLVVCVYVRMRACARVCVGVCVLYMHEFFTLGIVYDTCR